MGRRRGRTGPGGAVVSSLSKNSGGTVNTAGGASNARRSGRGPREEDTELLQLANLPTKGKKGSSSGAGPSNMTTPNADKKPPSASSASSSWLGKTPQQMLREWCTRNNRKRPYFSRMAGSENIFRCTIPAGRKDGKRVKGSAFDMIIGVGERSGEEFAALNVLHQVERGKPLERLLAPEFRDVWLDLDKRFDEMQKGQEARTAAKQARKEAVERRAKYEKSKESGTINISSSSRQMIEDALVEHQATNGSAVDAAHISSLSPGKLNSREAVGLRKQLMEMGFSELDAIHASRIFRNVTDALDYLCLNLDESELPSSLAPTSDIEVVRFKASRDGTGIREFDPNTRDKLANLVCLSQRAAERVLRVSDTTIINAAAELYSILTQNVISSHMLPVFGEKARLSTLTANAVEERSIEGETLTAIYGDDANFGVGVLPLFPERWSAVIRLDEGAAGVRSKGSICVALVDVDGLYPYSAPVVLVHSDFGDLLTKEEILNPAQRRLLMRAIAGEVSKLRQGQDMDKLLREDDIAPVPLGHAVVSFLSNASTSDLLSSAAQLPNRVKAPGGNESDFNSTVRVVAPSSSYGTKRLSSHNSYTPQRAPPPKDTPSLEAMRKKRRLLPAHNARNDIVTLVTGNQVTVVSGATGSGKTTQVPQFLLEHASESQTPVSIVCTQPRRIAAMSVAERVASERCEKVGGVVGYQVKLNSKVSSRTRLVFCTTGVLLRRLQSDSNLESLTHVVVDEVHERSVETDFLLLLLREILKRRPSLRVVLMSATLDAQKFSCYFEAVVSGANANVPIVSIPGRTFPVNELYLADAVELAQYQLRPGDRYAKKTSKIAHRGKYGPEPTQSDLSKARQMSASEMASMHETDSIRIGNGLSQSSAQNKKLLPHSNTQLKSVSKNGNIVASHIKDTVSLIDESIVNIDLIDLLVKRIDAEGRRKQEKGAILIFLPGAAEISSTIQRLSSGEGTSTLWPLPLHSLLSPQDQSKVFQKAPTGKRKVICATNIAETSITVEDVTVVIDTMRVKEMSYDSVNGSSVLRECFISKAAAKQRAGRAGRVSEGTCYRLVRQQMFDDRIAAQQVPEIKRVSLEHLVLNIVSIVPGEQYNNNPQSFLASAIDPPDSESVKQAISNLIEIGALESTGGSGQSAVRMTALGRHLSGLPVDARIGKLLIYGSVFKCIDAALTIAATVSERSPFFAPFDKREEAKIAREPFVWGKSDLLTFVKAFDAWREVRRNGKRYADDQAFCTKHFLSRKTLQSISDGRKQLADALADAGFGPSGTSYSRGWERDAEMNKFGKNLRVLRAVVCAALYPNVARIDLPNTVYREVAGGSVAKEFESRQLKIRAKTGERLFLHPESVNFLQGNYETRWLAYFSKVKTSKLYIRDTTMVSPYAILLFGGEIAVHHQKGQLSVDKWVVFKAPARVAVLARELRRQLDALLLRKFEDVEIDLSTEGGSVTDVIVKLITSES